MLPIITARSISSGRWKPHPTGLLPGHSGESKMADRGQHPAPDGIGYPHMQLLSGDWTVSGLCHLSVTHLKERDGHEIPFPLTSKITRKLSGKRFPVLSLDLFCRRNGAEHMRKPSHLFGMRQPDPGRLSVQSG